MDSHLVAVKVCVKGGTHQGMQLNRFTFYQNGLKCLNTQSVQRRGAVQHYGMFFNYFLQHIPDLCLKAFHHFLSALNIMSNAFRHQFFHYKRLKQFDCHFFRQAALVDFELRAHHDNRTAGIVHTLAQQVLAESSLFTFQHIGKGFQGAVARACYRAASAAIIDQRVYCFLQHALLVSHDNIRGAQFQQARQAVIPVDNPSVQVIQVGGGEPAAVQLHHGAQIRGNHRNRIHDHPLRLIAGSAECLHYFQALDNAGALLSAGVFQPLPQFQRFLLQINSPQQLLNRLSSHPRAEGTISAAVYSFSVFLLGQNLLILQVAGPFIQYNIRSKI